MTLQTTDSGLQFEDLQTGSGQEATGNRQTAVVHYTGWLEDGSLFDSSKNYNEPFSFSIARGKVIKGWDEGIIGMKVGGIRKLIIPAELGYGKAGAAGIIPPDATLVFEIELLDIYEF